MSKLMHVKLSFPVSGDGFIHLGNWDVIKPEVLADGLRKSKLVHQGSVQIYHDKVGWVHHLDPAMAEAVQSGVVKDVSVGFVESSFLKQGSQQAVDGKTVDP